MKYYIVDDDLAIVKSLERIIEEREIGEVCGCSTDPGEALREILQDKPDIVLVDMLMEGMDGVALVEKIKARRPGTSCVMISKVTDKELVQNAYKAGVEFFINKPINIVEVETVLGNVADKLKMQRMVDNIRDVFDTEIIQPRQRQGGSPIKQLDILFGELGMLGERGVQDIRLIFERMTERGANYDKTILGEVAEATGDTVKNVEQRVRRAIKKGLTNAAMAGSDDFDSEIFVVYAGYVFDFQTLKEEMNYLSGDAATGGRVSISRFMEGLKLYIDSME